MTSPELMVRAFESLVRRHEQMFYNFVHQVHSKGSDLFVRLIHWIERIINYVRDPRERGAEGLGVIDLEACLPSGVVERQRVMDEVDAVISHAYKLKLLREIKMRRRMARAEIVKAGKTLDVQEEAFMGALSEQFGFGDALNDQLAELESSDESDEATFSDSDDDDDGPESADRLLPQNMANTHTPSTSLRSHDPPRTDAIESIRPIFMELLQGRLG